MGARTALKRGARVTLAAAFLHAVTIASCGAAPRLEDDSKDGGATIDAPAYFASLARRFRGFVGAEAARTVGTSARVGFAARADEFTLLESTRSGVAVRFALEGAAAAAALRTSELAVYRGAFHGGDILHRTTERGLEDFVVIEQAPAQRELRYTLDVSKVAGLRLVANVLELLDPGGAPRLRVTPPYVIQTTGLRREAELSIDDCAIDTSGAPPWGRPLVPPGRSRCTMSVRWSGDVTYPLVVDPRWEETSGDMAFARAAHFAAALPSGRVLIGGGVTQIGPAQPAKRAEMYDPTSDTFSVLLDVTQPSTHATVTTLDSGDLVIIGTCCEWETVGQQAMSLRYDVASGTLVPTPGSPMFPRYQHTATLLPNGLVLVAGGMGKPAPMNPPPPDSSLTQAELLDPNTGYTLAGTMVYPRAGHTASLLPSGEVLIVGGHTSLGNTTNTAEIYQPDTGEFVQVDPMNEARGEHTATVLPSGKILLAGGYDRNNGTPHTLASAEIYDPETKAFSRVGSMSGPRAQHTATLLADGTVVIIGGRDRENTPPLATAELFEPATETFRALDVLMRVGRRDHTATLLPTSHVLVTGGYIGTEPQGSITGPIISLAERLTTAQAGEHCAVNADCESDICENGTCCSSACPDACTRCGAKGCEPVVNGDDPGTCDGERTCNEKGKCKVRIGRPCSTTDECIGGRCDPGAHLCVATTCKSAHEVVSEDSAGSDCSPYLCKDGACLRSCISVKDCVEPTVCDTNGHCIQPPTPETNPSCATGTPRGTTRSPESSLLVIATATLLFHRRRRSRCSRPIVGP